MSNHLLRFIMVMEWPANVGRSNWPFAQYIPSLPGNFQSILWSVALFLVSVILDAKHEKIVVNIQDVFFLFHIWKFLPTVHCKYIQCNFYTFYVCPNFHCNLSVLFTFHLITAPSTVKKCKHWFTVVYCNIYISTL